MQRWQVALSYLLVFLLLFHAAEAAAQVQPPSDRLLVDSVAAWTWTDGRSDIIQLQGPVTIRLDRMELSAHDAVIWLTPEPGLVIGQERAEIALVADAAVREPARGITRQGSELFVSVAVRGDIRITADQRLTGDQSATPLYLQASALRAASGPNVSLAQPLEPESEAQTEPPTVYRASPGAPARAEVAFRYHFSQVQSIPAADGTVALVGAHVVIIRTTPRGDTLELQADRAVIFTHEKSGAAFQSFGPAPDLGAKISAAYLEGDVRIDFAPGFSSGLGDLQKAAPDQRLAAQRVYYDFDSDQAVLTDAVLRTSESEDQIPITIRAEKLRQLAQGEYSGEKVQLSTSSFATPTYSVRTDQVYVHETQVISTYTNEPESQANFVAQGDTLGFFNVPLFYFPTASGSVDEDPFPVRNFDFSHTGRFGTSVTSELGVYELLGHPRPPGLDLSVLADFFSRRGPATGINGKYSGDSIDQDDNDVSDFDGSFHSFIITEHGYDRFGEDRSDVTPPDQIRGKFLFEHQQFLSDHWQAQIRLGYDSDPTFLEEYFPKDFYNNQPYDAVGYLKRQQDTEAITILANADTNRFVTTSDQQSDQFDVEKLPELGYRRIGDSLADDNLTFFSQNTLDRLLFARSQYSLAQQGFVGFTPGIPNEGYTGTQSSPVDRADSRQEVDYPVQLGQIKMVPYVVGRATGYSDTPAGNSRDRYYGAGGVRFTTDFWKVDDSAQSDLFDLSRVRHIIEPELNLYASGQTLDRSHLYIYEQDVDGISDVSAIDAELHQRWQTYRGAPGRQESVDFLTVNVSADIFTNPPTDAGILPDNFRGIYFPSDAAASIPRDAINSDAKWLVSDSTAVVADSAYNVDHGDLATGSFGLAAQRYDRLAYYVGLRYIDPLDSDRATCAVQYALTSKYDLELSQSYDFGQDQNVDSEVTLRRKFDRLTAEFSVFHDAETGDSGLRFNVFVTGLQPASAAPDIGSIFNQ